MVQAGKDRARAKRQARGAVPPRVAGRPRVYAIGPNKCGTTSLYRFFTANQINAAHWVYQGRNLAVSMVNNMALGRHPMDGFDAVEVFTDLNHIEPKLLYIEGMRFFREIHRFEPDAYFILNTRPMDKWLTSRVNHGLCKPVARMNRMTEEQVLENWRRMFEDHKAEVRAYFAGNPRFIEFDIESDPIETVIEPLSAHYTLDPATWGKHFATADKAQRPGRQRLAPDAVEAAGETP